MFPKKRQSATVSVANQFLENVFFYPVYIWCPSKSFGAVQYAMYTTNHPSRKEHDLPNLHDYVLC